MSHVATVDVEITNLEWLAKACDMIGLEFAAGQQTYRWFGKHVGDYPLPVGFGREDLGKCEHAIRLPRSKWGAAQTEEKNSPYEIGVVPRRDGRPGWSLLWDFFAGGFGLQKVVGDGCCELVKAYSEVSAREQLARKQLLFAGKQHLEDGSIRMVFRGLPS